MRALFSSVADPVFPLRLPTLNEIANFDYIMSRMRISIPVCHASRICFTTAVPNAFTSFLLVKI